MMNSPGDIGFEVPESLMVDKIILGRHDSRVESLIEKENSPEVISVEFSH